MKSIMFFISIMAIALAACSKSDDGKGGRRFDNVSDLSSCNGPAPIGASPIGEWESTFATDGLQMILRYAISNDNLTAEKSCLLGNGEVLDVLARGHSTLHDKSIVVINSDSNETRSSDGSFTCPSQVSGTYTFQLVGNCINLEYEGEKVTLVRVP